MLFNFNDNGGDMNALEMALEALTNPSTIAVQHAIDLIKEELAKPEQEAGKCGCGANLYVDENGKPCSKVAKPEQEPVELQSIEQYRLQMAAICTAAIGYWKESDNIHPDYDSLALRDVAKLYAKYAELYTTPPRKEWVGLTDDDHKNFANATKLLPILAKTMAEFIETILKEKNGG
jgi:hypothetical protein